MTETQSHEGVRRPSWGAVLHALGAITTVIATMAAAYSAWASWQSMRQSQETQLLQRSVEACFEIDRHAAAQLQEVSDLLEQHQRSIDWPAARYSSGGYTVYMSSYRPACSGTESEIDLCETARARLQQRREVARQQMVNIGAAGFEAARTFSVIGPDELAEAEANLSLQILRVSSASYDQLTADDGAMLNATMDAQTRFRELCRSSLGEYRRR